MKANSSKELFKKITALLKENDMYHDVEPQEDGYFQIFVTNGDWKHDHLRLQHIMRTHGYTFIGRYIDEDDNDDDSFSAVYLYSERS